MPRPHAASAALAGSRAPLSREHDLAMLDLDGVVYVGGGAVPGAPEALRAARGEGLRVAFVTNNAARTATTVAAHLRDLGVEADADDVVTSAQAAAALARERHGAGARVLVLGAEGLRSAARDAGLVVLDPDDAAADDAELLITGYGPDVLWRQIMSAAVRVRGGLPWIASNTDRSIPTPEGLAPGHGVLVELIARFAEVDPLVAGKPARPLLDVTLQRVGAERALMVGDRIDTDIDGGHNAQVATLLVMTGVSGLDELAACAPSSRPTHLGAGLEALSETHPAVQADDDGAVRVEGWSARVVDGVLDVRGEGSAGGWWRACAVALWHHLDEHGQPADVAASTPPTT